MSHRDELLAAAHSYSQRGWRVIPLHRVGPDGRTCSCRQGGRCSSAGKHPKDEAWQNSPAMSAADIQETWGADRAPNLGLAVGDVSGIWVLDIDPKSGGLETMAELVAEHGAMPTTFVVQTGSGGYHYYFSLPDFGLRNTQGQVGPGVDTRATGGQVVAAPSRSGVGDYEVIVDAAPAPAPSWLLEMVRKREVEHVVVTADLPRPGDIEPAEWERLNGYAQKAIKGNLDRLDAMRAAATTDGSAYRGEPWNATTFQVTCALLEIANSPWCEYGHQRAMDDILAHAPRDSEFDDWVVKKTIDSAREKVGDKARAVPADRRAEPDPLFNSPDVRPGPTKADGEPAGPVSGYEGPERFFDKKSLLVDELANAVMAEGPLAWGADGTFWSYDHGVWSPDHEAVERRVTRLLRNEFRKSHAENTAIYVKHSVRGLSADPIPQFINFQNGLLDWRTGDLHEHTPEVMSTVQLAVDYLPEATCPNFDRFLSGVMHEDYVDLAWEMIGYLMYSGNPLQVAFLLFGSGGNGKGTLIRVLEAMLGHRNLASESLNQLNGERFSPINLYGRLANIAGDIDGTYQENTAAFKKLTGEDTFNGEHKYGKRFQFENWAVPLFSANKIPGSADVTQGYLRRWVVLHFHRQIAEGEIIPGFSGLLIEEAAGVAAKGILALRTLMDRERFDPQGEATKGAETLALQIDQVRQWVASGDPLKAPEVWTPLDMLYSSYSVWANRSGQARLRESEFQNRLEGMGFEVDRQQGILCLKGLSTPVHHGAASAAFF